jgi:hypothetical protein
MGRISQRAAEVTSERAEYSKRFILSILTIHVNGFAESVMAQRLRIRLAGKLAYRTLARREEKRS